MNIYHVLSSKSLEYDNYEDFVKDIEYDTYSDLVVIAPDEDAARQIPPPLPSHLSEYSERWYEMVWPVEKGKLVVSLIGKALPNATAGIVCSSFHAG